MCIRDSYTDFYRKYADEDGESTAEDVTVDTTSNPERLFFKQWQAEALFTACLLYTSDDLATKPKPPLYGNHFGIGVLLGAVNTANIHFAVGLIICLLYTSTLAV